MSVTEIFWLFLILTTLQPALHQRMLNAMRARKIAEIEKQRGSRVILLVHRQETMRLLGFPLVRYIDVNDSEEVLRAIHLTDPEMPLDIVLHTPGGLVLAALQIARAIEDHKGKVTVFVPHYAMSGGTLIALAADEIVMCRHSVLGPIDPQIGGVSSVSLLKIIEEKPIGQIDDHTIAQAHVARRALAQIRAEAKHFLSDQMPEDKAAQVAELLSSGAWTHDYPISANEARALGLRVATDMPKAVLELMTLFPQPVRAAGGVEYLPGPRGRETRPKDAGA